jgi:hypothetical protein
MRSVHTGDGHIAHHLTALGAHEVDRAEHRAGLTDRAGDARERPRQLPLAHAHRDAVGRRRLEAGDGRRARHRYRRHRALRPDRGINAVGCHAQRPGISRRTPPAPAPASIGARTYTQLIVPLGASAIEAKQLRQRRVRRPWRPRTIAWHHSLESECVSSQRSAAASALAECPREALAARADSRVSVFGVPAPTTPRPPGDP